MKVTHPDTSQFDIKQLDNQRKGTAGATNFP
jgi:hypothetical protein